jgi:hypothetical protein
LFFLAWPIAQKLCETYGIGIDIYDWKLVVPYIPLWILGSTCVGIASLGLADAVDWALFSFVSAGGSGFVMWFVLLVNAVFIDQMKGTMQLSMHAAVTGLFCVGLSLSAGCISLLSALFWIVGTGFPSKSS